jgi:pimeloyl-ACP methyl ester carboxylesterase
LASADRLAWARGLSAISVFDVSVAIQAITCPVVLVAAGHDTASDPQAMAAMAARLAHSELRVIDDAWHMSVFTDPARLVSLLVAA